MNPSISLNTHPVALLRKLDIAIKKPEKIAEQAHLPVDLGNYLDGIIQSADYKSLKEIILQVMAAITSFAVINS